MSEDEATSRSHLSVGGIVGAVAGTVVGGAAAVGGVAAGRARSKVVRERAALSAEEEASPSTLGLLPEGRESSVAADEVATAAARLDEFLDTWGGRYPAITRLWRGAWSEFIPFLDYDVEIRRVICST